MSERPISTVQLGLAAAPVDLTFKNLCNSPGGESRSSSVSYCPLCVCVCVFTSRWWAWTLIKGLSPEEALQVRAKVASLEALKGQRADLGLQRAWEGNYLVSMWDCSEGVGGVQQYESLYVGTKKVNKERSSVRFSYVCCLLLSSLSKYKGCF